MNNAISITFGAPEHSWLPVDFRYSNFHINFDASDALNDPIKELSDVVNEFLDNLQSALDHAAIRSHAGATS